MRETTSYPIRPWPELRACRLKAGHTYSSLAKAMGTKSRSWLMYLEDGRRNASFEKVCQLAQVLGVSLDELQPRSGELVASYSDLPEMLRNLPAHARTIIHLTQHAAFDPCENCGSEGTARVGVYYQPTDASVGQLQVCPDCTPWAVDHALEVTDPATGPVTVEYEVTAQPQAWGLAA